MYLGESAMRGPEGSQPPALLEDFSHFANKVSPSSLAALSEVFHSVNNPLQSSRQLAGERVGK
jgi:hypothetical protein